MTHTKPAPTALPQGKCPADPTRGTPAYRWRYSARAQRLFLRVTPIGLEVVLPLNRSLKEIPSILCQKQVWITNALERMKSRALPQSDAEFLPASFVFPILNLRINLRLRTAPFAPRLVMGSLPDIVPNGISGIAPNSMPAITPNIASNITPDLAPPAPNAPNAIYAPAEPLVLEMLIHGTISDRDAVQKLLLDWLALMGRRYLAPLCHALALEHGISISSVSIRRQKSRWGSCSIRGAINLNARLLFFPPELCRAVILHEFAHTAHMNHSAAFWAHLQTLDMHARAHNAALRSAPRYLPPWAALV